jgi:putative SOS response-associated peptidase YedK
MSVREIVDHYEISNQHELPNLAPRYNIAPSQSAPIVKAGRILSMARWGLIPSWAKDAKIGYKTINARAETVAEKPSFRSAFKARCCLIPATGFCEWKAQDKGAKQPYYIHGR